VSRIHPTAVVASAARLADDVVVGPYSLIGEHAVLAAGVRIGSHVVIEGCTEIGEGSAVHAFAVLGGAPQHAGYKGEPTRLVIGPRNLIREHVTMHCGTAGGRGVTTVGADGYFMVGVHIGHDCIVGDHVIMANNATLGGHVTLADFVIMGGLSAAHQNTRVGRHAFVGGMAGVNHDVIPFGNVWGNHAHLEGLNLVGIKRRGFSREAINALRAAYRMLFAEEGTFQERLEDTAEAYHGCAEVMEIVEFIRADASRPLTTPQREV
jgi:UDP-N-acetylglucosamine acyltransferase